MGYQSQLLDRWRYTQKLLQMEGHRCAKLVDTGRDAILGTDSLAKVYPFSSIVQQARFKADMKELGICSFAQRGTPRSSVRLQAEGPKE